MSTYLLWCDLETTGLSTDHDEILEAAFILTDTDLNTITWYRALAKPTSWDWLNRRDRFVVDMHLRNGLLTEVMSSSTLAGADHIDADVDAMIRRHWQPGDTVHLAGSGVAAFDSRMICKHLPSVYAHLHYAPIDVGVLKRTWQMWTGSPITTDEAAKNHRAMDDVEGHLREARAFRDAFQSAVQR